MANPNLGSATNVYANNASLSLGSTTEVQLVSNAASSGKVYLIDGITIANIDTANPVGATVTLYQNATNSGTAYELCSGVAIPAKASLIAIDKGQGLSLLENQSIYVSASVASKLRVNASWKELS